MSWLVGSADCHGSGKAEGGWETARFEFQRRDAKEVIKLTIFNMRQWMIKAK